MGALGPLGPLGALGPWGPKSIAIGRGKKWKPSQKINFLAFCLVQNRRKMGACGRRAAGGGRAGGRRAVTPTPTPLVFTPPPKIAIPLLGGTSVTCPRGHSPQWGPQGSRWGRKGLPRGPSGPPRAPLGPQGALRAPGLPAGAALKGRLHWFAILTSQHPALGTGLV